MGGYICKKALTLGGERYVPGDMIPASAVMAGRELKLSHSGYIVQANLNDDEKACPTEGHILANNGHTAPDTIILPVHAEEGLLEATVSPQSVYTAFNILQLPEKEASAAIKATDDDDALMLANAIERRKGVAAALAKRHGELTKAGDADVEDV